MVPIALKAQSFFTSPIPIVSFGWIWPEQLGPVRFKAGLSVGLQRAFAAPERVLPTPTVLATLAITEIDTDSPEFGLVVSDGILVATAKVSVEEIAVPGDAAVSLREP